MNMGIVTVKQLANYIETYLSTVLEGIGILKKDEQSLFEFQKEQPMRCIGFISNTHGAAVAFFPSDRKSIEIRRISKNIESIFPKDPKTGNTLIQTQIGPDTEFDNIWRLHANLQLAKAVLLQRKKELVILEKGLSLRVNKDSVFMIEDRLILKGSNKKEAWSTDKAIKDAMWFIYRITSRQRESDIRQLGAKVEEYKRKYHKVKTELGILVEYPIRELCRKFDGREVDGKLFGISTKIRLPDKPDVKSLVNPQIDAVLSDDEIWAVEVKKRNRKATVKDLKKLEKKGKSINANRLWFISESGFKPKATEYARKNGILISDKNSIKELARMFRMQI
jgi:hypothetical protein